MNGEVLSRLYLYKVFAIHVYISYARHTEMKTYLRAAITKCADVIGFLGLREARMSGGLTILLYHRILPWGQCSQYPLASLVVPDYVFREQMRWLFRRFRVKPIQEAIAELHGYSVRKRPLVSVTFDDGYDDNYRFAAPILEEFGLTGTFFVTTGFVASGKPQWYDIAAVTWQGLGRAEHMQLMEANRTIMGHRRAGASRAFTIGDWMACLKALEEAPRRDLIDRAVCLASREPDLSGYLPMTPDNVKSLHDRGHEIASHTVSHPILPQLSDAVVAAELEESAEQLRNWTGAPVTGFCYPNGDYGPRVERAVTEAGYEYACTVSEGTNFADSTRTRLKRVPVTMRRTMRGPIHDEVAFRAEVCRLRALWQR